MGQCVIRARTYGDERQVVYTKRPERTQPIYNIVAAAERSTQRTEATAECREKYVWSDHGRQIRYISGINHAGAPRAQEPAIAALALIQRRPLMA